MELHPEPGQTPKRAQDPAETEELAPAIEAWIVMYRNLTHAKATAFDTTDEFNRDAATNRGENETVEDILPNKPEVAIDVTRFESEDFAHELAVRPTNCRAIPRIAAFHFPALNHVVIGSEFCEKVGQFARIVLTVTICVEDQVLGGSPKATLKSSPVTSIAVVSDDSQGPANALELIKDRRGAILAAIVDDDDLEIVSEVPECCLDSKDQAGDRWRIVIAGEKGCHGGPANFPWFVRIPTIDGYRPHAQK